MKLYDYAAAPNPRRVRIFLAEKGLDIPVVTIDLSTGQQFSAEFRAINPSVMVPMLELDDGTRIGEVLAICRYIEEIHPLPPLMGTDPREKALITMWERRMEMEGQMAAAEALRNSAPGLKDRALPGPHRYEQIPALAERGKARLGDFYADLDARLIESPFVAGGTFSIADITAIVAIDFAAGRIQMPLPQAYQALWRWYKDVSTRPSMRA